MGTSVDKDPHKSVIRLLQHSILQLCNEHVGYSNKLQILGVLCMTIDDEPVELVVKVNNTLKRVAPNTPAKDVSHQPPPQTPALPVGPPAAAMPPHGGPPHITPITISPVPSAAIAQNLTHHFTQRAEAAAAALQQQQHLQQQHLQQQLLKVKQQQQQQSHNSNTPQQQDGSASPALLSPHHASGSSESVGDHDDQPHSPQCTSPAMNLSKSSPEQDAMEEQDDKVEHEDDEEGEDRQQTSLVDSGASSCNSSGNNNSVGAEKKSSQGRKARKPTKVHHVYDEGEFISEQGDDNEDVLTVIPTDPDQPEEEVDMQSLQMVSAKSKSIDKDSSKSPQKADRASPPAVGLIPVPHPAFVNVSIPSSPVHTTASAIIGLPGVLSPLAGGNMNLPIMRQALEQGAAAAMASAVRGGSVNLSPYRNHPYAQSAPTTTPSKPSGSASIRALLQAQAQMRQQMRLAQAFAVGGGSPAKHFNPGQHGLPGTSPSRSGTNSPIGGSTIVPINVVPDSCSERRGRGGPEDEQHEALDFSHTADPADGGELVIDERPTHIRSSNHSGVVNVKGEVMDYEDSSDRDTDVDLSHTAAAAAMLNSHTQQSHLTSTPVNFPHNPFAAYAIVDGFTGLSTYAGLNLSTASSGLNLSLNGNNTSPDSGLSIQYTPNGPITVGPNGQNVSNSPQVVKDLIMYNENSPLKQQKGNKVIQEGDFMLDKFGLDPKRRRRRSPDETLTAEEIAEYMGATNLGAANSGPNSVLFKCKYCPDEMQDLVRYLQHTLTVHNAYICHQCGKSFTTKSSLLRHRPIHTGLRRFACSICKKTFYRKDKCKSHIKRHLGPADQNNVDQYQQIEPVPEMPDLR